MSDNRPIGVWAEFRTSTEGVSVTLYSESAEGTPVVEDELWFTHDELQEGPQGIETLRLTQETRAQLKPDERGSQESQGRQIEKGDILRDDNAPSWSDNDIVVVVEPDAGVSADAYYTGDGGTVADANPSYPADDTVVRAVYRSDVPQYSDKTIAGFDDEDVYAFPESRLVEP